jgi:hypothetical protein
MNVTPHVAAKATGSAIDRRTIRHAGYAPSQRIRKRIEEAFGWGKTVGPIAQTMLRGIERVGARFTFTLTGYNLARGLSGFATIDEMRALRGGILQSLQLSECALRICAIFVSGCDGRRDC